MTFETFDQRDEETCRMQGDAVGDAGGCSGVKLAAAKADYSRSRQTIADQG